MLHNDTDIIPMAPGPLVLDRRDEVGGVLPQVLVAVRAVEAAAAGDG